MAKQKDKKYTDFVPYEKSSKKEKRKRDREKRNTWEFNPVTKVVPDKRKKKDRRDKRRRDDYYSWEEDYEQIISKWNKSA